MIKTLKTHLGANWKTTLSGWGAGISSVLATLATISLTSEGQAVIAFLSPESKVKVAIWSAAAALAFRFWNAVTTKDRDVTGGTVAQDENNAVARPQPITPNPPKAAIPRPNV